MIMVDLASIPAKALRQYIGADALIKLLLKYSRESNFFGEVHKLMREVPEIFLSLSIEQAKRIFEYVLYVGKGTKQNAQDMKAAMNQLYGEKKAAKIFSLADYFRKEGVLKSKREIAKKMLAEGESKTKVGKYTGLSGSALIMLS